MPLFSQIVDEIAVSRNKRPRTGRPNMPIFIRLTSPCRLVTVCHFLQSSSFFLSCKTYKWMALPFKRWIFCNSQIWRYEFPRSNFKIFYSFESIVLSRHSAVKKNIDFMVPIVWTLYYLALSSLHIKMNWSLILLVISCTAMINCELNGEDKGREFL